MKIVHKILKSVLIWPDFKSLKSIKCENLSSDVWMSRKKAISGKIIPSLRKITDLLIGF